MTPRLEIASRLLAATYMEMSPNGSPDGTIRRILETVDRLIELERETAPKCVGEAGQETTYVDFDPTSGTLGSVPLN